MRLKRTMITKLPSLVKAIVWCYRPCQVLLLYMLEYVFRGNVTAKGEDLLQCLSQQCNLD